MNTQMLSLSTLMQNKRATKRRSVIANAPEIGIRRISFQMTTKEGDLSPN